MNHLVHRYDNAFPLIVGPLFFFSGPQNICQTNDNHSLRYR